MLTPPALAADIAARLPGASVAVAFDGSVVEVPAAAWRAAGELVRADERIDCEFFDFLTGVDEGESVGVVAHVWSPRHRHHVLMRSLVPAGGQIASLVPIWPGADWHERETWEMFGVGFTGHPNLVPLLLGPALPVAPLRKGSRT